MSEIIEKLSIYFQYPFVIYALIVGVLISLCASLLGVTLVMKRFSFIGDGLSHVAFGALALSSVLKIKGNMPFILIVTIIVAILILKSNQNKKISSDAMIALISVSSLAIGYLMINLFAKSTNISGDVCTTLFGSTSILTLDKNEVTLSIILSIIIVSLFICFYNKIFLITFNEDFAISSGINVSLYNLIIAIVIAIVIVLSMNLVGSLLITALIVFPTISSNRIFNSFKSVTIGAIAIGILCSFLGIIISILAGTPVGSTIVLVEIIVFFMCFLIGNILKRI
ncbi:MAG: metal ABC transporter permease [Eubacteriales bacterium]|nr:metal ABC transporter permease [Eubacteriales bacterium]